MDKILITGGAGFIGSSLADQLVQNPDNYVVLIDNLLTGSLQKLPSDKFHNWKFVKCNANDYADISALMFSHSFDYVFHYAAVVGVQRTLNNPTQVLEDIQGIKNILHLSKNTGVKRVFYASSSEVYGESVRFPQDEISTPLNSRLPYAVVKNVGEAFCTSYHREFGLDYTILRFFNTFGPKQSADFVISKFLRAALQNQPITIYGDGLQSRTFCYIDDNVEAVLDTFYNNRFINDVINIGNDIETTILDLALAIQEVCDTTSKIVHLPPLKEGDMSRRQPNLSRMVQLLNRPHITLTEGLRKIVESDVFHVLNNVTSSNVKVTM